MRKNFDIGIIGAGVAGCFAALRLAERHKGTNNIIFDLGRPPGKRRRQLEGWLGCFPTGDGKIYTDDLNKVLDIVDGRKAKSVNRWVMSNLNKITQEKIIKGKLPNNNIKKLIKEQGFDIKANSYIQWVPSYIHQLSKNIADRIEGVGNVVFNFDNEVISILKQSDCFVITTKEDGDFFCKKIILCTGRSGWRWIRNLYNELGILTNDNIAKYGITIEIAAQYVKGFNKSHCLLSSEDITIGPFSWDGTIIQEDHLDMTVASFRSNESRWHTDKVSFPIIYNKYIKNEGCKQTDRLAQLAFLLAGDRVGKEKVRGIVKGTSQISMIPEYSWLKEELLKIEKFIPSISKRGSFYYPTIDPTTFEINLGSNLETEIPGLYVAGENTGVIGLLAAAITGGVAADSASQGV